jgi:hypothetical protein
MRKIYHSTYILSLAFHKKITAFGLLQLHLRINLQINYIKHYNIDLIYNKNFKLKHAT